MNLIQVLVSRMIKPKSNNQPALSVFDTLGPDRIYALSKIVAVYRNNLGERRKVVFKNRLDNGDGIDDCIHLTLEQAKNMTLSRAENAKIAIFIPE